MLKVGIIGIGNTGNQVAELARNTLNIPVLAINSSDKDLETLSSSVPKKLIKDNDGITAGEGAGKDRSLAKKYLKESIIELIRDKEVIELVSDLDIVFIVSSTGGGTGSGTAPLLSNIISSTFKDVKTIMIGVLPVNSEALSAHVNTLEYLDELYKLLKNQTYMLYDNDKLNGLPSYKIMNQVNQEIVRDIDVLRCTYNYTSKYDTIDNRDMMRLLSYPGRIVVSRLEDFNEKSCDNQTIEDMIIDNLKRNTHVESQRDKRVMATGIITNLSYVLNEEFDNNTPKVREFMGVPVHSYSHTYVNEDRKQPNNVFYILSGLSAVNDKINIISDRIEEIEMKQKIMEEEDALADVSLSTLSNKISDKKEDDDEDTQVNLSDIFSSFGI